MDASAADFYEMKRDQYKERIQELEAALEKIIRELTSTYCPYCVRQAEIAGQALKGGE